MGELTNTSPSITTVKLHYLRYLLVVGEQTYLGGLCNGITLMTYMVLLILGEFLKVLGYGYSGNTKLSN